MTSMLDIFKQLPENKQAVDIAVANPDYKFKIEKFIVTQPSVEELLKLVKGTVHSLWAGTGYLEQYLPTSLCFNEAETTLPCFTQPIVVDMLHHMQTGLQECDTVLIKHGTLDRLTLVGDHLLRGQQVLTYTAVRFDINTMVLDKHAARNLDEAQLKFPGCYGRWVKFTKE